jgi:peptidoglycan/xylan/chitin deacetylase (PgdA/CDA1 family)
MKILVSHDVDHITFWEHNRDLIVPKFVVRNFLELISRQISVSQHFSRAKSIFLNKWHNLEELMAYNKEHYIPATFFIGVSSGKGLVYSREDTEFWIKKIIQTGFDVGVHGIAFDNYEEIKKEHDTFKSISGLNKFGIRMHYLRSSDKTIGYLNKAGYLFDTTLYEFSNPYKVNNLWEFPLFIMDVYIIRKDSSLQNRNLEQAKEATKKIIDDVNDNGIEYLTVNLHDRFFHNSFKTWKEWYIWLITYLKDNRCKFISYREAVEELEGVRSKNVDAGHVQA